MVREAVFFIIRAVDTLHPIEIQIEVQCGGISVKLLAEILENICKLDKSDKSFNNILKYYHEFKK